MKIEDLPKTIPVFPLSNFIIFPRTTVPLNIFEPRYIEMINDSMKSNKLIGMIQPKNSKKSEVAPELYDIGCMGKITSFRENDNGQFLIELKGVIRFQKIDEVKSNKKYRECNVDFNNFYEDLSYQRENLEFSDLKLISKINLPFFFISSEDFLITFLISDKPSNPPFNASLGSKSATSLSKYFNLYVLI